MPIHRPTQEQLREIAEDFGMHMSAQELNEYLTLMGGTLDAYDAVHCLPDYLPKVKYPRTPGYRPSAEENPLNAWYVKTRIEGAADGPLKGKEIVVKDNVCIAGVPMMNGSATMEGYVPDIDATIVTRMLDAGATILGKTHCESFCLSGGSHTNATGPVRNPHNPERSAGGSSSGSGALVGANEVDMAIGSDQGGSVRMPSAFCGCYGMKGTHGLVPYTGAMPIEMTVDHLGPITNNVADNALLLETLAGADGLDPRQYNVQTARYTEALGQDPAGMRVAIITEGFGHENSEADVDEAVRAGADRLKALGVEVDEVSLPMHALAPAIWTPIAMEGLVSMLMEGNSMGSNWKGLYNTSLLDAHAAWRQRADELSPSLKICMFVGKYFQKYYRGHYYAKAQNLNRQLRAAYDAVLKDYDALLMPTVPMKATPLPAPDAPLELQIQRAFEMVTNTAPFNATGHPSMSLPCGMRDGLPVGMMLTGKYYDESSIYKLAHAFEQQGDWRQD